VQYEELVSDKVGVARQALTFLGLEVADGLAIVEQTRRQGDELNDGWITRFHEIAALQDLERSRRCHDHLRPVVQLPTKLGGNRHCANHIVVTPPLALV
jgi:hypothetical protein